MSIEIKKVTFKELKSILTVEDSMSKSVEALYNGKEESNDLSWGVYNSDSLLIGFSYNLNPLIPFLLGSSFVINRDNFRYTFENYIEIRQKIEKVKFDTILEYDLFGTINCCPVRLFNLYNRLNSRDFLEVHKIGTMKKDTYPRNFLKKILVGQTKHDSDLIFFLESIKNVYNLPRSNLQ